MRTAAIKANRTAKKTGHRELWVSPASAIEGQFEDWKSEYITGSRQRMDLEASQGRRVFRNGHGISLSDKWLARLRNADALTSVFSASSFHTSWQDECRQAW